MTDLQQEVWAITARSWIILVHHGNGAATLDLDNDLTLGSAWTELRRDGHTYRVIVQPQIPHDSYKMISVPHLLSVTVDGQRVLFFKCHRVVDFAAKHWKEDVLFGPVLEQSPGTWPETVTYIDKLLSAHQTWLNTEDSDHIKQ